MFLTSFSNLLENSRGIVNNITSKIWLNKISKEGSKQYGSNHQKCVFS